MSAERAALYARLPVTAADRWWLELARRAEGPVLDLGAGPGRLTGALAQTGTAVVAVEREPAMLAELEPRIARLREVDGADVELVRADVVDLPDGPPAGLVVLATSLLNELADPAARRAALAGAARRCRADGLVALHLLAPDWLLDPPASGVGRLRPLEGGSDVEVELVAGGLDRWAARRHARLTYRFADGTIAVDELDAAVVTGAELDDALATAGLVRVTGPAPADDVAAAEGLTRVAAVPPPAGASAWYVLARPVAGQGDGPG